MMRIFRFKTISAMALIALFGFIALYVTALTQKPLDPELAYEALRIQLQRTEAGRHALDFSSPTMMERREELLFFGRADVRLADRVRDGVPLIENYDIQYIA